MGSLDISSAQYSLENPQNNGIKKTPEKWEVIRLNYRLPFTLRSGCLITSIVKYSKSVTAVYWINWRMTLTESWSCVDKEQRWFISFGSFLKSGRNKTKRKIQMVLTPKWQHDIPFRSHNRNTRGKPFHSLAAAGFWRVACTCNVCCGCGESYRGVDFVLGCSRDGENVPGLPTIVESLKSKRRLRKNI